MTVNSSKRSLRQHIQRSLGDDFVEPPSVMGNDDDDDDDGTEDFQLKRAPSKGRSRGGGRQSRGGRKASSLINQVEDESMETNASNLARTSQQPEEKGYFHHLLTGKTNIQVLVDQWIDSYQANRDEALIELMQFFLDSAGCKGKLTQAMYLKMEHVDMLRVMTEHFDEVKDFSCVLEIVNPR